MHHFRNEKMVNMPKRCIALVRYYSREYGGCGEVCLTAFVHYAVFELGLKSEDGLYTPEASHKKMWGEVLAEEV